MVSILDEASGEIYRNFVIPQEYQNIWKNDIFVRSIDLSPDFTSIAICSGGWWNAEIDVRIFIYDIASGELLNTLNNGSVIKIEYSPNGDKLAVIQTWGGNAVSYYDTQTWKRTKLGNHSDLGTDISFSPDGTKLASCGWDGYIKIWDVEVNKLDKDIKFSSASYDYLIAICFDENNNYLYVSGGKLKEWKIKSFSLTDYSEKFDFSQMYLSDNESGLDLAKTTLNNLNILCKASGSGIIMLNLDYIMNINEPLQQFEAIVLPNPNTAISTINITLSSPENIELKIVNQEGIEIESVFSGILEDGEHNFTWDGSNYPSGVYYCRVTGKDFNKTLKIILEK